MLTLSKKVSEQLKLFQTVVDGIDTSSVRGIAFDATCSMAVLDEHFKPVSVSPSGKCEVPVERVITNQSRLTTRLSCLLRALAITLFQFPVTSCRQRGHEHSDVAGP